MKRFCSLSFIFLFSLVLITSSSLRAEEKLPKGKFIKKTGEFELTFEFKKDKVVFEMTNGSDGCVMESTAKYEKDGVAKCEVTKFEKIGSFPAEKEKGYKYSFKFKVNGKTVVVSDLEGDDLNDEAKSLVQGDYEPVEKNKKKK